MLRKILFRLLIVIAVGLIALLGTAFYKKATPLSILQGIFQNGERKNDDAFNTGNIQRDIIKEKLKAAAENNAATGDETASPSTGNTDTANNNTTPSNNDRKDTQNLVNSLVDNAQ